MFNGDFLETINELHHNRGVDITSIAKELGISRRMVNYLRSGKKQFSSKILKRADMVFPNLLSTHPRRKQTTHGMPIYFLEDSNNES